MIVSCMQCQMKFKVDDGKIGPRGVKVRCIRCQTMIIVKPPDPLRDTSPDQEVPQEVFQTTQQEAPTRVHQLDPAARAALEQAAQRAEKGQSMRAVGGGSFGLDGAGAPQDSGLPPLPAFSEEPPIDRLPAPPPLPGPPPLKKPAGAPPPNDDLFSSPFGPEGIGSGGGDKFMDAGAEGPTLELDSPAPAPKQDALADLPRFDASEDMLQMSGGMSAEGAVTKPVSVQKLKDEASSSMALVPEASVPLVSEPIAPVVVQQPAPPAKKKSSKSPLVRVGQVMMAAFILSGYAGLYLLWQAGGVDAFLGRPDVVRAGGLVLQYASVAPFVAKDGTTFWVVRGEAQNTSSAPIESARIKVALEGHAVVSVPLGAEPDAQKLYTRAEIVQSKDALAIQPEQRLPFTAVVPATGLSIPTVTLSL